MNRSAGRWMLAGALCLAFPGSPKAAEVSPVDDTPTRPQIDYDLNYIGFDDFLVVGPHFGAQRWTIPYEGKFKKPLDGAAFYEKLGRQDLVQSYESRSRLRTGLMIAGVAVAAGGIAYATIGMASNHLDCGNLSSPGFSACVAHGANFDATPLIIGGVVTLVGGGVFLGGASINPDPVDVVQMRQLAEQYNESLRGNAMNSDPEPASGPSSPEVRLAVSPVLGGSGGGLQLEMVF
jgi:hypothetical protein